MAWLNTMVSALVAALTSSTTVGARHSSSKLGSALAVAVVAVVAVQK